MLWGSVITSFGAYFLNSFYSSKLIDYSTSSQLKDIFPTGYDYIGEISSDIKAQMKSKMAQDSETMYFYSDSPNSNGDFYQIAPNVDYYFDNYGHLMIAFSEASVAPAYYGPVTFTVSDSITSHLSIKP